MSLQPEILLIAVAAVAPAAAFALLLTGTLPRATRSWVGAATGFAWGLVVAAPLASRVNDAAGAAAITLLGSASAQRLVPALVGPAVEELAKAGGLLAVAALARRQLGTPRGAATAGAVVGLGFAAMENVTYYTLAAVQGGGVGVARALYLRGLLQGLNHATFTAVTGAAVGSAVARGVGMPRMLRGAGAALLASIAIHAVWNAVASVAITNVLCNAPLPGAACAPAPDAIDLLVTTPAIVVATIGPVAFLLGAWLRRDAV